MINTKPRIVGGVPYRVAEHQPQYTPVDVVAAVHPDYELGEGPHNSIIMAFALTAEERQALLAGEELYVALLTYGEPQQPITLSVGPAMIAAAHNLKVEVGPRTEVLA